MLSIKRRDFSAKGGFVMLRRSVRRAGAVVLSGLVFAVLLSGCLPMSLFNTMMKNAAPSRDSTRTWAKDHAELLELCGQELLSHYPSAPKWTCAEFTVRQISGDRIMLLHSPSGEQSKFRSTDCQALLEDGGVEKITVTPGCVEFDLGGSGFGSQTDYYTVCYLPEDDLSGCFGFDPEMVFSAQDGGWIGRRDDDNTFFYQCIGEHLYYCWAHF